MKKLLALTLALLMLFAACACGAEKKTPVTDDGTAQENPTQPSVTTEKKEDETTRAPWKPPVVTTGEGQGDDAPVIDLNVPPATLADGTPIQLVSITDGTLTVEDAAATTAYATSFANTTATIFADGATVDTTAYKGVMVKVKTTNESHNGLYLRFKAKLEGSAEEVDIKASERSYQWFNGTKWATVTGGKSNWVTPNKTELCWVYVPFPLSEITAKLTDFGIYCSKSSTAGSRAGEISEFSFVKATGEATDPVVDEKPKVPELAAPAKLADNTPITLVPVSDGVLSAAGSNVSGSASNLPYQTTTIFKDGAKIDPAEYKGMLIKVATTTENNAGLYMRFYFKLSDDTEIQVNAKGKSVDFWNGTTWTTYETAENASNWVTPSEPVGYLYFAFPFPEVTSKEVVDIRIYSNGSATRLGTFSDWSLVKAAAD